MSNYYEKSLKILKEHNFRVTNQRKLVIKLLDKSKAALSAYEIKGKLDKLGEKVDIVSIYRIIDCLEENKLIHRVLSNSKVMKCQLPDEHECDKHEDHHCHHLLVCKFCGSIEEVHCTGIDNLILKVEKESKFKIASHNIEFYGKCKNCT